MTDKFEKIKELKQLLDHGLIDDQEYSQLKKELLQDNDNNQESSNQNKVPKCLKPFYWIEKRVLEPIDSWISRQAFVTILGRIGNLTLIVALFSFILGGQMRRNNQVFTAWQTITSAYKQGGSGGRIKALEFLNSRPWRFPWIGWTEKDWYWNGEECKYKHLLGLRWQREPLDGISVPNGFLANIHLCGAELREANLSNVSLYKANLNHANLLGANLDNANLRKANLNHADLLGANLNDALLGRANLNNAILRGNKYLYSQIKSACFWQNAIYVEAKFNKKEQKWIPKNKQKNQNIIQEIKQAETSNASTPDKCREIWKND